MQSSEMKNSHLALSPQEQWVLRGHSAATPGPTSPTRSRKQKESMGKKKVSNCQWIVLLGGEGGGKRFFTFFEMFSKLGLLMREKARRNTSAPL